MIYIILFIIAIWVIGRYEKGKLNQKVIATNSPISTGIPPQLGCNYDVTGAAGTTITQGAGPSQPQTANAAFTSAGGFTVIDVTPQCAPPPFGLD